jgi:hypothetical protein
VADNREVSRMMGPDATARSSIKDVLISTYLLMIASL